ncbi:transposase [Streptomyces celluloflavus]|uniref:transposase n=1 Tax=Streptomyces celluloflavus TaxID=58344 RepID=UPI0036BF0053
MRRIAAALERSPSTISREIHRNRHPTNGQYRPHAAEIRAESRRPRPKPAKIAQNPEPREYIQERLGRRWSPERIVQHLHRDFPDRPEMHVDHETIYQALYVQGRGELRRELAKALRTGRARRKPRRQTRGRRAVRRPRLRSAHPFDTLRSAGARQWTITGTTSAGG